MIKERPILFNAPMVRAILDGRKTQTRRIIKNVDPENFPYCGTFDEVNGFPVITFADDTGDSVTSRIFASCKFGKPGDRLWVRETFSYHEIPEGEPFYYPADRLRECVDHDYGFHYWADGQPEFSNWSKPKPSIHMPRSASRILLEVTNVRVERLNEISEEDAMAEGINIPAPHVGIDSAGGSIESETISWAPSDYYKELWESINGKGSWNLNPWVWVVEFKEISK